MKITYNENKRAQTLRERGLDFAHADQVFAENVFTVVDNRENYGEERFQTIGPLDESLVMVVWTPRGRARRVISMRKCTRKERIAYQKEMDRSG